LPVKGAIITIISVYGVVHCCDINHIMQAAIDQYISQNKGLGVCLVVNSQRESLAELPCIYIGGIQLSFFVVVSRTGIVIVLGWYGNLCCRGNSKQDKDQE